MHVPAEASPPGQARHPPRGSPARLSTSRPPSRKAPENEVNQGHTEPAQKGCRDRHVVASMCPVSPPSTSLIVSNAHSHRLPAMRATLLLALLLASRSQSRSQSTRRRRRSPAVADRVERTLTASQRCER